MAQNESEAFSRRQTKKPAGLLSGGNLLILFIVISCSLTLFASRSAVFGNAVSPNGKTSDRAPIWPAEFLVEKVIFASTNKFNLASSENKDLGMIEEIFLSLGRTFRMYDASGTLVGIGHQKAWAPWGTEIELYDGSGRNHLATFKEEVSRSVFNVSTVYKIIGPSGTEIGESVKVDLSQTDFSINDPAGKMVVSLHRPSVNWVTDTWTVHVYSNELDNRIAPMIGAFKTAADDDKKSAS